jgi:acyl-coenzyme A thioesterase PaaI-like protein
MNKIQQKTHVLASKKLIGKVISIEENTAIVQLKITKEMIVDSFGLSHGSFAFGLADYAAMVAINHPNVVLGKAEVKFLKPSVLNDELTAKALITENNGKKITVLVEVFNQHEITVFEGAFVCFILEEHILKK